MWLDQLELFANLFEHLETEVEIFACMNSRRHDADTSGAHGYHGEFDGGGKDSLVVEKFGEFGGFVFVADHNWGDGSFGLAGVEAHCLELAFQVLGVFP